MWQRHPVQAGPVMFITTNLQHKISVFADPAAARIAVETLYSIQIYYPFFLYGFVIMPDHGHYLVQVPEGGSISKIMGVYKRAVTYNIGNNGHLWQSRFHLVIPKNSFAALAYIHQNPVKALLCKEPRDYPWSSASGKWDAVPLPA